EAVVEGDGDRLRREGLAAREAARQVGERDDAVAAVAKQLHLRAEGRRGDAGAVHLVVDAVVVDDARLGPGAAEPRGRGQPRAERVPEVAPGLRAGIEEAHHATASR